jgi:HK97 family phage major capsid protein
MVKPGSVSQERINELTAEVNGICDEIEKRAEVERRKPVGKRAIVDGGFGPPGSEGGASWEGMSTDERGFRLGSFMQQVAASALPAGRKLGGKYNTGSISAELMRSLGLEGAVPSGGGFLISTGIAAELLAGVQARAVVYPKTSKFALTSNTNGIKIPGIDETSRASTRWGGIVGYWENEGASITSSKPKFRNVELNLNKLTALVYVSDEILEDASILGEVLEEGFKQEFAFKVDDACIRGSGAGQPLGILNGPCLASVVGASSANTIVRADVIAAYARMAPSSMARAEWFANVNTLPQLMQMTLGDSPIWLPAGFLRDQPNATLLGKPINFIEQCSSVGTVGDLILADFSQYITISRGLKMARSVDVAFTTDETAFRFILRIDGQPGWHSAVTPYKGSDALSPFVCVGTRT